jgi:surface protein
MRSPLAPLLSLLTLLILTIACSAPIEVPTVERLTIDDGARAVEVGATLQLSATVVVTGDASTEVTWASDDISVATVSAAGLVTGIATGEALITATSSVDASRSDAVSITVSRAPGVHGVTIHAPITTLGVGSTVDLSATVDTAGGASSEVTWRSDDAAVASVDGAGRVEGVAVGTAVITATSAADESLFDSVTITVEAAPTEPGVPAVVAVVAGDAQTATVGSAVAIPPSVLVRDANAQPLPGVSVSFAVTAGGGSITPATPMTTDENGIAALGTWTLGTLAGANHVRATITGSTGSIGATVAATGTPGPASPLTSTVTAVPVELPANGVATSRLTVQLKDAFGNEVGSGGVDVSFAPPARGSIGPVTNEGNGRHAATYRAGTRAGAVTIIPRVGDRDFANTTVITLLPAAIATAPMVITVDTTLGDWATRTVGLPLGGDVDVTIDWGDGTSTSATSGGTITHTYASDGRYTIHITGTLTQFGAGATPWMEPSAAITSVETWGELGLTSLAGALADTQHLTSVPAGLPATVTDLSHLFHRSAFDEPTIVGWDVSQVTNMSGMCRQAAFNQPLGTWDVSSVTDMSSMFLDARFDHPLGDWDVSSVRTMRGMFGAFDDGSQFNQDIGGWDVSNVTDMSGMFYWSPFDQDIGGWDVSNVTDMSWMFAESDFRRPEIATWDVSNVTTMSGMFFNTFGFDHDLSDWDVSNVTDMSWMFGGDDDAGTGFSQDLDGWDVSNVTNMSGMFANGAFDGRVGAWDVSSVTDMSHMFRGASGASRFDQDIGGWDVSSVTNMVGMFDTATEFDQDLSRWCVSEIPSEPANFAVRADSWLLPKPMWGTCPNRD